MHPQPLQSRVYSVSGELNSIGESRPQIMHEVKGATGVPLADEPAGYKFCVGVNRNPCPSVAATLRFVFGWAILALRINERPNLITLDPLAGEDCDTPCPDTQSKHGQDRAEACQQCCATRPSYARRLASNCPQPMRRRFAFFPQGSACSCIEHA